MDFSSLFSGFKKKKEDGGNTAPKQQNAAQPALNQNLFNFSANQNPAHGTQSQPQSGAPAAPAQQDMFSNLGQPAPQAPDPFAQLNQNNPNYVPSQAGAPTTLQGNLQTDPSIPDYIPPSPETATESASGLNSSLAAIAEHGQPGSWEPNAVQQPFNADSIQDAPIQFISQGAAPDEAPSPLQNLDASGGLMHAQEILADWQKMSTSYEDNPALMEPELHPQESVQNQQPQGASSKAPEEEVVALEPVAAGLTNVLTEALQFTAPIEPQITETPAAPATTEPVIALSEGLSLSEASDLLASFAQGALPKTPEPESPSINELPTPESNFDPMAAFFPQEDSLNGSAAPVSPLAESLDEFFGNDFGQPDMLQTDMLGGLNALPGFDPMQALSPTENQDFGTPDLGHELMTDFEALQSFANSPELLADLPPANTLDQFLVEAPEGPVQQEWAPIPLDESSAELLQSYNNIALDSLDQPIDVLTPGNTDLGPALNDQDHALLESYNAIASDSLDEPLGSIPSLESNNASGSGFAGQDAFAGDALLASYSAMAEPDTGTPTNGPLQNQSSVSEPTGTQDLIASFTAMASPTTVEISQGEAPPLEIAASLLASLSKDNMAKTKPVEASNKEEPAGPPIIDSLFQVPTPDSFFPEIQADAPSPEALLPEFSLQETPHNNAPINEAPPEQAHAQQSDNPLFDLNLLEKLNREQEDKKSPLLQVMEVEEVPEEIPPSHDAFLEWAAPVECPADQPAQALQESDNGHWSEEEPALEISSGLQDLLATASSNLDMMTFPAQELELEATFAPPPPPPPPPPPFEQEEISIDLLVDQAAATLKTEENFDWESPLETPEQPTSQAETLLTEEWLLPSPETHDPQTLTSTSLFVSNETEPEPAAPLNLFETMAANHDNQGILAEIQDEISAAFALSAEPQRQEVSMEAPHWSRQNSPAFEGENPLFDDTPPPEHTLTGDPMSITSPVPLTNETSQAKRRRGFPAQSINFRPEQQQYRPSDAFPEGYSSLVDSIQELKTTTLLTDTQFTKQSIDNLVNQYFACKEAELDN